MDLENALHSVDQLMVEAVRSDVPVLEEASAHILASGGKRVRPRLLMLVYEALGGEDLDAAVRAATAIELVHTATLVHDDINDHSLVRRGSESINARWGRTFALLTGDFLFTKVYELMAPLGDLNVIFAEAVVSLVEGETLQAAAAKAGTLNRETYQQIIAKKTASLFRASAMIGAKIANADETLVHKMGEFGFYMGLLFQVVDDLLDLTGDPALMGKPVGVDVAQGRGVASIEAGSNGSKVAQSDDPFLAIKRDLVAGGAIEEGRKMIGILDAQARTLLAELPAGSSRDQLGELLSFISEREI